jgi:hypothetical protein
MRLGYRDALVPIRTTNAFMLLLQLPCQGGHYLTLAVPINREKALLSTV